MDTQATNAAQLIAQLFRALDTGIVELFAGKRVHRTIPSADMIDPERFNRATVNFNGIDVTVSMTAGVPGIDHSQEPLALQKDWLIEAGGDNEPKDKKSVRVGNERKFLRDHRDNQKLHELYVSYAIEELTVARQHMDDWDEFSRLSARAIASAMWEAVRKEILEDAAWFEAAAIVFSGDDRNKYMAPLVRGDVDENKVD